MRRVLAVVFLCLAVASAAQAAFIVEPHNGELAGFPLGKAHENFSGTPRFSTFLPDSQAVGLTPGIPHAYGSTTASHFYTATYTPGSDPDNTVFAAGTELGAYKLVAGPLEVAEDLLASGLEGNVTGIYNIYVTWQSSANVPVPPGGTKITVTWEGGSQVFEPVNQHEDNSLGMAGANKWLKVASEVPLEVGNSYEVSFEAPASWTSQRLGGVMWEAVPEPATLALLLLGGLFLRRRV